MTAVKERFMQILAQMQRDLPQMPDSEVQQMIDIYINWKPEKTPNKTYKKREYVPNPKYTEKNRTERMARFMKSAGTIEIDEDAVRDMRKRSMI